MERKRSSAGFSPRLETFAIAVVGKELVVPAETSPSLVEGCSFVIVGRSTWSFKLTLELRQIFLNKCGRHLILSHRGCGRCSVTQWFHYSLYL